MERKERERESEREKIKNERSVRGASRKNVSAAVVVSRAHRRRGGVDSTARAGSQSVTRRCRYVHTVVADGILRVHVLRIRTLHNRDRHVHRARNAGRMRPLFAPRVRTAAIVSHDAILTFGPSGRRLYFVFVYYRLDRVVVVTRAIAAIGAPQSFPRRARVCVFAVIARFMRTPMTVRDGWLP